MSNTAEKLRKSPNQQKEGHWRLQDAKAKLSEVVRLAREHGPQHVSVHGQEAVVIVDAKEYRRLCREPSGRDLVEIMANSPLGDIPLERRRVPTRGRVVDMTDESDDLP